MARSKARGGEGVGILARDLVALGELLGGVAHARLRRGVERRLPQEVLELDLAHLEAAAVRIGGDRVARHGLGAHAQHRLRLAERELVGRLQDGLETRGAQPLHQQRRHADRHARVEADVARKKERVEARLRHRGRHHGVDLLRAHARGLQRLARRLDAEVGRRYIAQRAVVVGERRARAADEPGVVVGNRLGVGEFVHVGSFRQSRSRPPPPARHAAARPAPHAWPAPRAG